jgi:hypothetical protein
MGSGQVQVAIYKRLFYKRLQMPWRMTELDQDFFDREPYAYNSPQMVMIK